MFDISLRFTSVGPPKTRPAVIEMSIEQQEELSRALEGVRDLLDKSKPMAKKAQKAMAAAGDPQALLSTLTDLHLPAGRPLTSPLARYESDARIYLVSQALTRRISLELTSTEVAFGDDSHTYLRLAKPESSTLPDQAKEVVKAADRRNERRDQILTQVDDPHYFFHAHLGIGGGQHAATLEVMEVVGAVVNSVVHPFKDALQVPRPSMVNQQVRPMIRVPSHFSFPSGHSTYSFAQAITLFFLTSEVGMDAKLAGLAGLIAENREIAGLHYPMDSEAGRWVGLVIGLWLNALADGPMRSATEKWPAFNPSGATIELAPLKGVALCDEWALLYAAARQEWPAPT